jgi:hypothetical protein
MSADVSPVARSLNASTTALNSSITACPSTTWPRRYDEYAGLTDNASLSSYCQSIFMAWLSDTTIQRIRTRTFWEGLGTTITLPNGQATFQVTSISFDPVVYTHVGNFPAGGTDYYYGSANPPCVSSRLELCAPQLPC